MNVVVNVTHTFFIQKMELTSIHRQGGKYDFRIQNRRTQCAERMAKNAL